MANTIVAGNGTNNGLAVTSDNTGALNILTGSGSGTAAISIDSSQNVTFTNSIVRSATAQASASGTSIDFTSIPAGVKRITVMFNGVSTNGTAGLQIQLGDSGGFEITGYIGASGTQANSTGFSLNGGSSAAATTYSGSAVISNVSGNIWSQFGVLGRADGVAAPSSAGAKTLSDTLTQLRVIASATGNPADTFDAGSINILYE
jgi:hypothetical protein